MSGIYVYRTQYICNATTIKYSYVYYFIFLGVEKGRSLEEVFALVHISSTYMHIASMYLHFGYVKNK